MGDYNDAFMRNPHAGVEARPKVQNRTNVLQLKLIGQSHPTGLTTNLLKLFEPRPPLEFKPPPEKRKCPSYTGIANFLNHFADPGDPEYAPPVPKVEKPAEKRARIHKTRLEKGAEKAAEEFKNYDPNNDPNASGDPYKTLFVARINYETSESKIKREFESYGPIKRVQLVTDKETNKPKGYAFIEYVHTRDMKAAYKQGDGRKIDGKRVLVDVERGRTVPNWRPRRLGGGLGSSRIGSDDTIKDQEPQRASRSQEPRALEEREKSRERVKEKDREKSRERSHDRLRERSHDRPRERSHDRPRDRDREDRHHRDRDRTREKDRSHRDRDRDRRDRTRDRGRDRDRDHHRDRDYDHERRRSREKEPEHDRAASKHRHEEKDYDHVEENDHDHGYYDERKYLETDPDRYEQQFEGDYGQVGDLDRYDEFAERNHGRYDQMDADDDYGYEREVADRAYRRSERSISRDYDH